MFVDIDAITWTFNNMVLVSLPSPDVAVKASDMDHMVNVEICFKSFNVPGLRP